MGPKSSCKSAHERQRVEDTGPEQAISVKGQTDWGDVATRSLQKLEEARKESPAHPCRNLKFWTLVSRTRRE